MARAQSLARKAGYNDVRVLRVEETDNQGRYSPMSIVVRASMNGAADKSTPIAPGEISVSASMSFTFEMVK
jgi:uncharacterized protein YggE